MNQEVVTNSNLGCVGKSVVHQDNIEHRYIEHNVTMVGNIGISCTLLSKGAIIQFDPFSGAPHEEVHGAQHVAFLKAQHAVHPKEGELQESTNPTYGQPWDEATKHAHEETIVEQCLKTRANLGIGVRPDVVKLRRNMLHNCDI